MDATFNFDRDLAMELNSHHTPDPIVQEPMTPESGGLVGAEPEGLPMEMPAGTQTTTPAQFVRNVFDVAAGGAKGATQSFIGTPGDLEMIVRQALKFAGADVSEDTILSTTDQVQKFFDQFAPAPVADVVPSSETNKTVPEYFGEFAAPGGYLKGISTAIKGAKKVAKKGAAATMNKEQKAK